MEKVNNSQHIERLCNPTVPRFRANVNRVTVNRSNLRVIEAKEETLDQRTNSNKPTNLQNNIKVPCVSKNVNDEKTLKNYANDLDEISDEEDNNDLDEISDSPLVDEADDWENISEGSLRGDSDVEERGGSTVLTRIEIPIGYRPYSIQRLTKYKNMAFFKPRMYYPSPNKVMVGCVSANEENGESFVRHGFASSGKENGDADVEIEEVESDEKNEIEMVVESPGKELAGPVRSKLIIQEELESSNEDILGVEFLVEVWKEVGVTFHNYLCLLCDEELEKEKVIGHFISIPHRIAYLDKHFPNFTSMFYKNSSLDNSQEKLPIATLVKQISGGEPALSFVTSCEYVSLCRQKLQDEVNAAVFRGKDPVTALVKELSLIVAARSEEFVNDFIDYSQYRTITTSDNALYGPLSKGSVDILPINQKKPCGIVTTEGHINQTCGTVATAKSSGKPNLPEKEFGKSERKKHSPGHNHHKQHCCNSSHRLSRSAKLSTAGAKLENGKSTSKGGSTKSAIDPATKSIPSSRSSSKADYKSRNEIDKRRTSSSLCGKCNGLKRSHDGNKGHTKRCDCKKDSSLTSGREIKRKDDSSKENLSRKSERSRSVTSPSNDKKKCTVKDSSSSRHSVATAKVYRSDSKYKWQSEAYRKRVMSKDGKSLESEKKDEKTGEKGGDHSRGDNHLSSATDQSKSHEKKINDDKRKHSSTSHQSRSPKRAVRVSPKSSDDKKSPLKENRDSSTLRKGRSPVHQSSGSNKTSSTSRHSPARSSTTEQKQRSLPDGVHTVSRHRSKSPHHSTRRRSRSPLSVRRRERPPFPLRRRSRSPLMIRKRSRSPLRRRSRSPLRRRSRSPLSMRRRSRSPLSVRKWSRSPNSIRKWSRSPLSVRRPLSVRKRSKTPSSVYRKRSRSPSSVGHINRQMASFRRVSPMSSRDSRSRHLSPHGRVRSPIRSAFKRSVSPLHRRRRSGTPIDSQRRSRSSSCTRSISNKGDSPFKQPFPTPFLNVDSHHENFQYPVPPVNSQSYTPDGFPAPWNAANPADNYNYGLTYPPVNPAYLPTTYPQYAGHPAHVPPYPNTAYPPPMVQPVPPAVSHAVPPTSLPTHPIPTRAPVPVAKLGTSIPVQYPNLETLPPSGHPNEKIFHELRNVVTKLFGMNETRPPPQMESRNAFPNKPPLSANERMLNRNVHSQDIPFLGAAGTSNTSLSHKSPEEQERMYVETLHKLRSEFGSFQIPDEIFKLALKGMFPEHLLNDQIFEMLNKKCLEQGEHLRKSPKLPNMSAKVEFKESTHFPKQGNIFPIVKPGLQSEAFANPNHNSGDKCNFSDGRQRNTNDVDFRVKSNFPAEVHRPGEGHLQAQFKKKTLAERLASVLTKLGMDDVSGELLIEMLHRLGAFNRSLPLQNITENQIIAFLNENGYLRRK